MQGQLPSVCASSVEYGMRRRVARTALVGLAVLTWLSAPAMAQKKYDIGASDTEIKIGQTMPYSGPASAFAMIGRIQAAYFDKLNKERGGIGGRKITFISLDDAYSPPKTVEQTRKLVEDDEVFAIASSLGSPTNLAVSKYLNTKKVPQILVMAGTTKLDDAANLPWTTTFYSSAIVEARIYADYLLRSRPDAKIAVIFQDDDFGRNYLSGLKTALGSKQTMIVAQGPYNITDPTIDSQMVSLKSSGADVLFIAATPKFAAQAIRKTHELAWHPLKIVVTASAQIETVLKPAGLDASKELLTSQWIKQSDDPAWRDDPAMKEFHAFFKQWLPGADPNSGSATYAYSTAQMIEEVLRRCGDELTRQNLMKQATNIKDFQLPLFLPGVKVNVSPNSRIGWRQARLFRFDGSNWNPISDVVTVHEDDTRM
ncbi:branched-chain amino acid transport system substrate-binding protein [Bradyrhizobium ottawaense]|uniref:ABC transporter substrate-binding protein n=1 Tax=Bradyrhizobium ottawaense TaxID=931866 RepID=UPI003833732F